jgi:hypothetical protein
MKFINKNKRCQYIGNIVHVNFRWKILIRRWKMKNVRYKNQRCGVIKMKNK